MKRLIGAVILLLMPAVTLAQSQLNEVTRSDTISSNGDSFAIYSNAPPSVNSLGGPFNTIKVQTLDSYSGTWEVQCSVSGADADFNSSYELRLTAANTSTVVTSVTDTVGIWDVVNAAGCRGVRVIATDGFAASDTVVVLTATQTGGGGSGGGGGSDISAYVDELEGFLDGLETSSTDIKTAVQLIDDAVYTEDGDITADTSKFLGVGCWYQSTPSAVTDGDGTFLHCDSNGALQVSGTFNANLIDSGTDNITEDGANAIRAYLVTGAGAGVTIATVYTEDTAFSADPEGGPVMLRQDADLSNTVTADDDPFVWAGTARGAGYVSNIAATAGGCTYSSFIGGASVNETAIKASAGQIYSVEAFSLDATPVYLKFYNDTTANIDETDTPVLRIMIPAASTASLGSGVAKEWPAGLAFSTAITVRTTTGIADNSTGALTADEVLVNVCYL